MDVTDPSELGFDPERLRRIDRHFASYVDDGRLAGWQILLTRAGRVVHHSTYGMRDRDAGRPVEADTLWRIYSMTKPITSVAAMMLWEEGRFELTDELARFIPAYRDARVYDRGSSTKPFTVPAIEPIRIRHLLTHTSGLTYGFLNTSVVDTIYRLNGFEWGAPRGMDLAGACDAWATLPLLYQPGTAWGYSVASDVLGRVVEIVSGQPLDDFLRQRIFEPLGMKDTAFWTSDEQRLARLYTPDPTTGQGIPADAFGRAALRQPTMLSGGGGLVSTAADYLRFTGMLAGGGAIDDVRLLGSRTVQMMTRNWLPGGRDLGALSTGGFAETVFDGIGFGLGFGVMQNPVPSATYSTPGEFFWGGAASTAFWVDPAEGITAHFFTQLLPSSTYPIRSQLRQLVYSALVD